MSEPKFYVRVYPKEKPFRISKELQDELKGVASGKGMAKMKKEAIDCPVLKRERPFLECFVCPNFMSRISGEVRCLGEPLSQ